MRKIYILLCLSLFVFSSKAQDIHFSQLNQTPLLLNPASTGVYDGFYRGILNFKNQWGVMGKPYLTFMGSYDMPVAIRRKKEGARLGLGGFLFYDKTGDSQLTTTQLNIAFSGIVPMAEYHTISAGIEAGVAYRSIDISAIQWPNQYNGQSYDPNLPSNEPSRSGSFFNFDMAAGIQYQYLKYLSAFRGRELVSFTAGAALFHATKPLQRFYTGTNEHLYPRIVVHSTLRYDFKDTRVGIVPSVLYMSQGPVNEIDAGILVRFQTKRGTNFTGYFTESAFSVGLHYRHKDAIIPQVFFEISDFGIGLSYDINISSFLSATKLKGGIEVSVKYAKMKGALNKYKK